MAEIPPFKPDYDLIEKQPRDWSGLFFTLAIFGMTILIGAALK